MFQHLDSVDAAWTVGQQSNTIGTYYGWWAGYTILCWLDPCSLRLCHQVTEEEEEEPHLHSTPPVEIGRNQQQGTSPPPRLVCKKQHGGKGGDHGDSASLRKWERQAEAFTKDRAPARGSGLLARLNISEKQEEGKVGEIWTQTYLPPSDFMVYLPAP